MSAVEIVEALATWRSVHIEQVGGSLRRLLTIDVIAREGPKWKLAIQDVEESDEPEDEPEPEEPSVAKLTCRECGKTADIGEFKKVAGGRIIDQCRECHRKKVVAGIEAARTHDKAWGKQRSEERHIANLDDVVDRLCPSVNETLEEHAERINTGELQPIVVSFLFKITDESLKEWEIRLSEPQARNLMTELFRVLPPE